MHAHPLLCSVRFCLVIGLLAGLAGSCSAIDLLPNASNASDTAPGGFDIRTDIDIAAVGGGLPPEGFVSTPGGPIWDGDHSQPDPALLDHIYQDLDTRLGTSSRQSRLSSPPGWRTLPSKGTVRVPVILVDFADAPHLSGQTASEVQSRMFGAGDSSMYPVESLRNFYQRSSYNQLTVQGDVYGWYRSPWTRAQYEQSARNYEARWAYLYGEGVGKQMARSDLVCEVLQGVDSQIDFSKYDNDNDGVLDAVFLKWAGAPGEWNSLFWACQYSNWWDFQVDGKTVNKYVSSWYASENEDMDGIYPHYSPRIDIHETGHLLGLPDYYDYDLSIGPRGHIGGWDMMGGNWGDHNAFSKYLLGWLTPTIVSEGSHIIDLQPSTTSRNAVLIMPGASLDSYSEFFMAEYREPKKGNDPGIVWPRPGGQYAGAVPYTAKGLFIWHVDARLNSQGTGFAYDNSYTAHRLLRFMEADGQEHLERGTVDGSGYYDQNDIYTTSRSLGPTTVPNSNSYAGQRTNVVVDQIQLTSTGARARFAFTPMAAQQPYNGPHTAPGTVQAEDYDFGGQNVAYYDTTTGNAGGIDRTDDVDIEAGGSGRTVGWVIGGEYLRYTVTAATAGDYPIALRAANPDAAAKTVTVSSGSSSTTISVASTGSFDTYRTFTSAGTLHLAAGSNIVKVTFGASRTNVDLIAINQAGILHVAAVPPGAALPVDTNGDGRYEDVNGNGRADFADVVLYFNQLSWIAANEPVTAFDCNGNGRVDFADVAWLFNHL